MHANMDRHTHTNIQNKRKKSKDYAKYYNIQMSVCVCVCVCLCVCSGPGVDGLAPSEASYRLQVFQTEFDQLWTKYTACSEGEELFGLTVNGQ